MNNKTIFKTGSFLLLLCCAVTQFYGQTYVLSNDCGADKQIEVVVEGVLNVSPSTIDVGSLTNVSELIVLVWIDEEKWGGSSLPNSIDIQNGATTNTAPGTNVNQSGANSEEKTYRTTFSNPQSSTVEALGVNGDAASIAVYKVLDATGGASYIRLINQEFINGHTETYAINIGSATQSRDIRMSIPIHEIGQNGEAEVTIAGMGITTQTQTKIGNIDPQVNLFEFDISSVPASTTTLDVTVTEASGNKSFGVGMIGASTITACSPPCVALTNPGSINDIGGTFCTPYDPPIIGNTTSPSGGSGSTIEYQWQSREVSTDCGSFGSWSDISGATSETYNPNTITKTTEYRRTAKRADCGSWLNSNVVTFTIVQPATDGGTLSADEDQCTSYDPAIITSTTDPSGGCNGSWEYQWEARDGTSGSFVDISGATSLTYDPPSISTTRQYRRKARRSPCTTWVNSNIITKSISSNPTLSAIGTNPTCGSSNGQIDFTFTNVPDGTYMINYVDENMAAQSFSNVTVSSDTASVSGLSVGTFNDLTITVSGCTSTDDVDIVLTENCLYDYGDLPDTGASTNSGDYQTLSANSGPSHLIISGLSLGASVDDEADGLASTLADGDGADEDGFDFPNTLNITPNSTFQRPLNITNTTGTTAHLEGWIDWNGDGDFDDSDEMIADLSDDGAGDFGMTDITINVPSTAVKNQLVGVRFRLSHTNNMTPYGQINSGEVEDYLIQVECSPNVCLPIQVTILRGK